MEKVKLIHKGGSGEFELDHAQAMLDLEKKNPPRTWSIDPDDANWEVKGGKIVTKEETTLKKK